MFVPTPLDLEPHFGMPREIFRLLPKVRGLIQHYFPQRRIGDAVRVTTVREGRQAHLWFGFVTETDRDLAMPEDIAKVLDPIAPDVFLMGRPRLFIPRLPYGEQVKTWESTCAFLHSWADPAQTMVFLTGSLGTPTPWLYVPSQYVRPDRPLPLVEVRERDYWEYDQPPEGTHRSHIYYLESTASRAAREAQVSPRDLIPELMGMSIEPPAQPARPQVQKVKQSTKKKGKNARSMMLPRQAPSTEYTSGYAAPRPGPCPY